MKIYVDENKHCHTVNDGTMVAFDCDFFDGHCEEFVEGYCYEQANGNEVVYPWKPYAELSAIQAAVDRTQAEADEELAALIEEIYQEDLQMMED